MVDYGGLNTLTRTPHTREREREHIYSKYKVVVNSPP